MTDDRTTGMSHHRFSVTKPYQRAGVTDEAKVFELIDETLVTKPYQRAGVTDSNHGARDAQRAGVTKPYQRAGVTDNIAVIILKTNV